MVSRSTSIRRALALVFVAPLVLAGCSAEFGGRCAETAECDGERVCIQGYCLPADSPDRFNDGGPIEGDGGPTGSVTFGESCDDDPPPAYDVDLRPCPDGQTAGLWRFDTDYEAEVPPGAAPVMLAGAPDGQRVSIESGVFGRAVVFDGGGDPGLAMDGPVRVSPPLTIELWARADGQDDNSRTLVGNLELDESAEVAGGFELTIDQTDGDSDRYQLGLAYADRRNRRQFETAATFAVGRWTHLAAVIEADGAVKLYVDGTEQVFDAIPPSGMGRALVFGRRAEDMGGARPYPGALDEVRVSTAPRSAETLRRVSDGASRPQ